MIESKDVAKEISLLMLEYGAKLDASVALVQQTCGEAELRAYKQAIGILMGDMLMNVMNPLYAQHPDLKPRELS
jgi:hypothetical protein